MKRALTIAALGAVALFAVFVVNQTAQVVSLANTLDPRLGKVVLVALCAVYVTAIAVPVTMILRLPRPLGDPPAVNTPEHAAYLKVLRMRLAANPLLSGSPVDDIDGALQTLDAHALEITKKTAAMVFVTTAVSQNGRLDALMVLAIQSRLVWRLAHLYQQRPTLRDVARLYGNVAVSIFLVSEIEDVDLSQQIQPVIQAALGGSIAGAVPGLAAVSTIVVQSMLEGTANAYLTLRVGVICQQSCGATVPFDARRARRRASVQAAGMLGGLVKDSASSVVNAIVEAAKRTGSSAVSRWNPFRGAGAGAE